MSSLDALTRILASVDTVSGSSPLSIYERIVREYVEVPMKSTPPLRPSHELMGVGATVIDSPAGPGTIAGFSDDWLPRVRNHDGCDVVRWCVFACGPSLRVFDPFGEAPEAYRR